MYIFDDAVDEAGEIGFDFRVPEGWSEFDLSSDGLAARREETLRHLADDPDRQQAASEVFTTAGHTLDRATSAGLIAAAGVCDRYEDGYFMANVTVFSCAVPPGRHLDPLDMVGHLHPPEHQTPGQTWLRTMLAELPEIGPCGRVIGVAEHRETDDVALRAVVTHTAVPVPNSGKRLLVSCTSPNIEQVDAVLDLFDAITATVRFRRR
ncbi:hypothetical protein [Salinactinospora qingdaonensis]|uniref:Uncharacterized protein n=1 Tax=Salinactinospora qingdaonensis TaxID=702744 RepID=A0ABP7F514_9ACTN